MGILFDTYLRLYPLSDELRASLAHRVAVLAEACGASSQHHGAVSVGEDALLNQQVDQVVHEREG
jgi:hypothetical protein